LEKRKGNFRRQALKFCHMPGEIGCGGGKLPLLVEWLIGETLGSLVEGVATGAVPIFQEKSIFFG
jgi:hypothetical protein